MILFFEIIMVIIVGSVLFGIFMESVKRDVPYNDVKYKSRNKGRKIRIFLCVLCVIIQFMVIFEFIDLPQPYTFVIPFFVLFFLVNGISEYNVIRIKMKTRAVMALVISIFMFVYSVIVQQILDIIETIINGYLGFSFETAQNDFTLPLLRFEISIINCLVIGGSIIYFFVSAINCFIKAIAAKSVYEKMNSGLGIEIKKHIPQNASLYIIYDNCIRFKVCGGEEFIFKFSQINMEKLPDTYLFPFFDWFYNNMITDKNSYRFKEITISSWSGGSSGYYQTTKSYDGYKTTYVSGDRGDEEKHTIGWEITSLEYINTQKIKEPKSW